MLRFLARRVLVAIPTIVGVVVIVFLMLRLIPGDPAQVIAGEQASQQEVERIRELMGLDQPLPIQFVTYIAGLAQGDFGYSVATGEPVLTSITRRLPNTFVLAFLACLVGATGGMALGILAAVKRRGPIDVAASTLSVTGISMPAYWLALNLVIIFAVTLKWLPAFGAEGPTSYILPTVTLATFSLAFVARMTRSSMLEVLSQDYVRTARAMGIPSRTITFRHALPNAMPPILTVIGLQFGVLLGGTVLVETVFSWPGMGRLMVDSIFRRDYPVVQGCVLVFAVGFILVNVVVDVLYGFFDPRVTFGRRS